MAPRSLTPRTTRQSASSPSPALCAPVRGTPRSPLATHTGRAPHLTLPIAATPSGRGRSAVGPNASDSDPARALAHPTAPPAPATVMPEFPSARLVRAPRVLSASVPPECDLAAARPRTMPDAASHLLLSPNIPR